MFHTNSDYVGPFTMIGAMAITFIGGIAAIVSICMIVEYFCIKTSILQLIVPIIVLVAEIFFIVKALTMKKK